MYAFISMPRDVSDYGSDYHDNIVANSFNLNSLDFPYTYSSTALTVSNVIDCAFIFNSLVQNYTNAGRFAMLELLFDLTGNAGAGNPTSMNLPCLVYHLQI